jgi:hypothetical protein
MRILVTVSDMKRLALVIDLESGEIDSIPVDPAFIDPDIVGRAHCRPFGITWSQHELFIANNRQLLVFDKQLGFLRIAPCRLQVNTHQLAYNGNRVWVASPWTNSLIGVPEDPLDEPLEFDLIKHGMRSYNAQDGVEEDDKHHFNSLLWAGGRLLVAAHGGGGPSAIYEYDVAEFRLMGVRERVGTNIHGIAKHEERLFWLSSWTGEVRSDTGFRLALTRGGWSRGLALTQEYFIVGISEFAARGSRHLGDSWIQVIDRERGTVVNEFQLEDTGGINDLRLLDAYDYAHWVDPFW